MRDEELLLARHEVLAVDEGGDAVGERDGAESLSTQHAWPGPDPGRHVHHGRRVR